MYSIPIDIQSHGRFYLLAGLFISWWLVTTYGKTAVAMSKAVFEKAKNSTKLQQVGRNSGWLAVIAVIVLLFPGPGAVIPNPGPQPDVVNPDPARKSDSLDQAFDNYRTLLSDLIMEFASTSFTGDDKKIEFLENRLNAAQEGAFGPFNNRLADETRKGPEFAAKLADEIKRREVK